MDLSSDVKSARVLTIYSKLVSGEVLKKSELEHMFHVTARTIQRDIESLRCFFSEQMLMQDIVYDTKQKGYRLTNTLPQHLTNDEILAICKILLEAVHSVGPHTISVPRVKHADDIDPGAFDNGISDDTFAKICALIRIAVPYTGMIISTREGQAVRERVLPLGVSQISGGSRTSVGGYEEEERPTDTEQFDVSDQRTLDEVVRWLMELGYIPSFCTACYREGRTGDRFMSLCKSGQIQNCCHPNALMTLKEYLMDYAAPETKAIGEALIQAELQNIPKDKVREICADHLQKIEQGIRDFRF